VPSARLAVAERMARDVSVKVARPTPLTATAHGRCDTLGGSRGAVSYGPDTAGYDSAVLRSRAGCIPSGDEPFAVQLARNAVNHNDIGLRPL
jgi:hypothetical protein